MYARARIQYVRATTGFIRLFIRGLSWDASEAGATLAATLKVAAKARLRDSARGKVLVGTGQGGASVNFTLPPLGDLTANDVGEVCSALLDAVDSLTAENPSTTDAELLAGLLAKFPAPTSPRTFRHLRPDFSFGLSR